MLPKKLRLSSDSSVRKVLKTGRSFFVGQILVKKRIGDDFKCTVVISKKANNLAVVRNRFKRIIRQSIYQNINRIEPGEYVFMIKGKLYFGLESKILEDFNNLLNRLQNHTNNKTKKTKSTFNK